MTREKWVKTSVVGYAEIRYTVYESDAHVVTDDDVKPPLVPDEEWLPWALYARRPMGRLELLGRFKDVAQAKRAARP